MYYSINESRKTRSQYVPIGLDLKDFLPAALHKHVDSAKYLLHAIESNRVFYSRSRDEFNPLKAAYLKSMMGYEYIAIRTALVSSGLVDCDFYYIEGEKAFGYRIGANFADLPFQREDMPPRIARLVNKYRPEQVHRLPVLKWLKSIFFACEIDRERAIASLSGLDVVEKGTAIHMLQDGERWFRKDGYGRLHTNITSLASGLRPFLSLQGERLVSIDVANSQPLFFAIVALNYLKNKSIKSFNLASSTPSITILKNRNTLEFLGDDVNTSLLPTDAIDYLQTCQKGLVYDEMMKALDIQDRRTFKDQFFAEVFYGKAYPNAKQKYYRERWPSIYNVLVEMKRKDYRRLSQQMQRAESSFIINKCCVNLMKRDIPVLTIHDALLTPKKFTNEVMEVMRTSFREIGIDPTMRVEV